MSCTRPIARSIVNAVIASRAAAPYGALARAHVLLGRFEDRMGHAAAAAAAYRAALAAVPPRDPARLASEARAGLRRTSDRVAGQAYALSLTGWRAYERGALDEAARSLDRALALRPGDPVAIFRRATVHRARAEADRALTLFGRVIAARPVAPPVFLARAYVERGALLESARDRAAALASYRNASRVFGADARAPARGARRGAPAGAEHADHSAALTRRARTSAHPRSGFTRRLHRAEHRASSTHRTPKNVALEAFFLTSRNIVLDTQFFSSIIYILYEGGPLRPPVVTPDNGGHAEQPPLQEEKWRRKLRRRPQEEGREEAVSSLRQ